MRAAMPVAAEGAQHEPQLQRAEAAAEADAVVHEVGRRVLLRGPQVLGHEAEGVAHHLGPAGVEHRQVHGHEHPLVRVDDDGVGALPAGEQVPQLGQHGRRAAVRRVHVQPEPLAVADVGDGGDRVDAGRGGRAHGGDHRERRHAGGTVFRDRGCKRFGPHRELLIGLDRAAAVLADAEHDAGLLDRRMRLLRGVDAQPRLADQAAPARLEAGHRFTSRR